MSVRKFSSASIINSPYKSSKFWDGETFPGYFESIATIIVPSGGSSSVSFLSIPSTYQHLQLRGICKFNSTPYMQLQFNGVTTGTPYDAHGLDGNGATVSAYAYNTRNDIPIFSDGSTSTNFAGVIIDILDYANTNKNKTTRTLSGFDNNGSGYVYFESGLWRSTSAITSITLTSAAGNFVQYSSFALYGIRSA